MLVHVHVLAHPEPPAVSPLWITLAQTLLAVAVLLLVAERTRALLFVAPVGPPLLAALERACAAGRLDEAREIAACLPDSSAGRVARAGLDPAGGDLSGLEDALLDVKAWTLRRLRAVRICATLASTLGLLGAIVALVRGFGGHDLLSLQAGLAQRVALDEALRVMGIGVATSAFCFYAFGVLRRAALDTLWQASRAARAVEGSLG